MRTLLQLAVDNTVSQADRETDFYVSQVNALNQASMRRALAAIADAQYSPVSAMARMADIGQRLNIWLPRIKATLGGKS